MRLLRLLFCLPALCGAILIAGCDLPPIVVTNGQLEVTATPSTMQVTAGTAGPAISFTITAKPNANLPVVIAVTPPAGIACSLSPCRVSVATTAANALTLTPSASLAAGTYTIPVQATSDGLTQNLSLTMTVVAPAVPPDFGFTVSPTGVSVTAGSATPAFSFTVTRKNGQTAPITITPALPAGFSCSASPCTGTVTGTSLPNAITLSAGSGVAVGSYPVVSTGTDGMNTHTVTATVTVVVPVAVATVPTGCMSTPYTPTTPSAGSHLDFTYTGASAPQGLVYDPAHNLVFESNADLNMVDVIDPNTMTLIHRIPVPQPTGMDLAADGKTLLVGSFLPSFFKVDTGTFCLTDREDIPQIYPTVPDPTYVKSVLGLSDGSVALLAYGENSGLLIWTSPGSVRSTNTSYICDIRRSGDRNHVFYDACAGGLDEGRYDVSTQTITRYSNFYDIPSVLAVNADGSRQLTFGQSTGVALRDANFNILATGKTTPYRGTIAAPDFSRFYLPTNPGSSFSVLDSALTSPGSIPTLTTYGGFNPQVTVFDGTGRILSAVEMGLGATPVQNPIPVIEAMRISDISPNTAANGLNTVVSGAGFTAGPDVFFGSVAGTNSQLLPSPYGGAQIGTTAPLLDTDCVNVEVRYPEAVMMVPMSYCYRPRILYSVGDTAPSYGGTPLQIYGMGFGSYAGTGQPPVRVRIGGVDATVQSSSGSRVSPYALPLEALIVTVPPGRAGRADIEVTTGLGTVLLPGAFTYVDTTETPLPTGADPYEVTIDSTRGRVLITDAANKQLLVYSTATKSIQRTVPMIDVPKSVAVTPEGDYVLVTVGDRQLVVLDAGDYSLKKQVSIPASIYQPQPNVFGLFRVVALAGGSAFLMVSDFYLHSKVMQYSLASGALTARTDFYGSGVQFSQDAVASSNGAWASVGGSLYDTAHDKFTVSTGADASGAVSNDGLRLMTATGKIFDQSGRQLNMLNSYDLVNGSFSEDFAGQGLWSGRLNPGSSLYIQASRVGPYLSNQVAALRLWDVGHGSLITQMWLDGNSLMKDISRRLVAADPAGQRVWMVTSKGLQDIQFAQDPLTVGVTAVNGSVLTVTGSGFTFSMKVTVDGLLLTPVVTGTQSFTASLPALAKGYHSIAITDGASRSYKLDLAFSTP